MYPWFSCLFYANTIVVFVCSIMAIIIFFHFKLYLQKVSVLLLFFAILLFVWEFHNCNVWGYLSGVFAFLAWLPLLFLDNRQNVYILDFITKWFAVFLTLSIVVYIFFLVGLFPFSPIKFSYQQYNFLNYYFFVIPQNANVSNEFLRFRSVFLEPGHMAMGVTILIFANKFNLKNKNVLALLCGNLFSFSLAAYVVMFIGFFMMNASLKGLKTCALGGLGILFAIALLNNSSYKGVVDAYIFNRLEYSETTGTIKGMNRTPLVYEQAFEETVSHVDTFWLGDPDLALMFKDVSGAGVKKYIVEKGMLGICIVVVFYLLFFLKERTQDSFVLTIVILLMLYQDAYPLWPCVPISYIVGNAFFNKQNNFVTSNS